MLAKWGSGRHITMYVDSFAIWVTTENNSNNFNFIQMSGDRGRHLAVYVESIDVWVATKQIMQIASTSFKYLVTVFESHDYQRQGTRVGRRRGTLYSIAYLSGHGSFSREGHRLSLQRAYRHKGELNNVDPCKTHRDVFTTAFSCVCLPLCVRVYTVCPTSLPRYKSNVAGLGSGVIVRPVFVFARFASTLFGDFRLRWRS